MRLTRTDWIAAVSAALFLGLLAGESMLVAEGTSFEADALVAGEESSFIDADACRMCAASASDARRRRVGGERRATGPLP